MPTKTCFFIGPIGSHGSEIRAHSDALLNHIVRPSAEPFGYDVIRADSIPAPGTITAQVGRLLIEADMVVADLTGHNPNVLYELGVRHALRRPAIQMVIKDDLSGLPFDIAQVRTIIFTLDLRGVEEGRERLRNAIRAAEEQQVTTSPISAALDLKAFEQYAATVSHKGAELPQVFSILKDVEDRLKALEFRSRQTHGEGAGGLKYSRRVFIVHGHDGALKNELARLLQKLDFDPVILHEQPDRGRTLFSKLNSELADIGFAFVILTPDDVGALASSKEQVRGRARQNVVFEHGLLIGHLSTERVCAICRGDVETPSDLLGVVYKMLAPGGTIASVALELVSELRAAGYMVDANKLV